jgi:hypothetical protein
VKGWKPVFGAPGALSRRRRFSDEGSPRERTCCRCRRAATGRCR